jgi:Mn-containing catalase
MTEMKAPQPASAPSTRLRSYGGLAARRTKIEELKADGLEDTPVPSNFPQEREMSSVAYKFQNFSEGTESQEGRWASGPSMDGKGEFEYVAQPEAMGPEMEELDPPVESRLYSTPKQPISPSSS